MSSFRNDYMVSYIVIVFKTSFARFIQIQVVEKEQSVYV